MNKFWNSSSGKYKIDPESLHLFLGERGYKTYKPAGVRTTLLVKIDNNRLREVSTDEIWKLCWNYIDDEFKFSDPDERRQVKDVFQRSRTLFHKQNLSLLKIIDLKECKDTKDKSFMFFKDCLLEITAKSVLIRDYNEIAGLVFETDISDFDLKPHLPSGSKSIEDILPEGEFQQFISDLSENENHTVGSNSLRSLISIIGYLVHRYKDPANAKAIIFMDTYKDDNSNGGTGKGVFTKGLARVRESAFQDGKYFSTSDKFAFSHINYGTRLLIIDDVPKNFDFEKLFPLITEKAVVEKKYENKVVIPFDESPKIVLTTNYTVEGRSSSHRRRKVEFIFSEIYHDDYGPDDKFGHLFYYEWDQKEWFNFYLFIVFCIQEFLENGILEPSFNVAFRRLKMETTSQFIEFAAGIELGVKLNKKEMYEKFYSKYPKHHIVELTTFRNWLKYVADAYSFTFTESHSGNDNFFEFSLE